jgi:hypothetical protein
LESVSGGAGALLWLVADGVADGVPAGQQACSVLAGWLVGLRGRVLVGQQCGGPAGWRKVVQQPGRPVGGGLVGLDGRHPGGLVGGVAQQF